jgi:hypothetical protein
LGSKQYCPNNATQQNYSNIGAKLRELVRVFKREIVKYKNTFISNVYISALSSPGTADCVASGLKLYSGYAGVERLGAPVSFQTDPLNGQKRVTGLT